jgi:hypothetical protein
MKTKKMKMMNTLNKMIDDISVFVSGFTDEVPTLVTVYLLTVLVIGLSLITLIIIFIPVLVLVITVVGLIVFDLYRLIKYLENRGNRLVGRQ